MFEFEPNPKNKTEYWNSSIQNWLKTIVYDNIAALTKNQTLAVFGTFMVSAFWHGIYMTYYFGTFSLTLRFLPMGSSRPTDKILLQTFLLLPQTFPRIRSGHRLGLRCRHNHDELHRYGSCASRVGKYDDFLFGASFQPYDRNVCIFGIVFCGQDAKAVKRINQT